MGFIANNIDALAKDAYEITKMAGGGTTSEDVIEQLYRQFLANGRPLASAAVAARHPEFGQVARMIQESTPKMFNSMTSEQRSEALANEFDALTPFYSDADWYTDPDYVSLALAYESWAFRDRREEYDAVFKELLALLDKQESLSNGARFNLLLSLWYWDYEGFQSRVMAYASGAVTPGQDGYIHTNMAALVNLAINLAKQEGTDYTQESIEGCLFMSWLGKRYGVAQGIAARHPEFAAFVRQIEADDAVITNPASSPEAVLNTLQQEAFRITEYKQQQSSLAQDVDFASLHLAFSCWMLKDAKAEYEEQIQPLFAVLDRQKELSAASTLDLIAAMWFWDYGGFQGCVMQRLQDIMNQYQEQLQQEQAQKLKYRRMGVCQYCGGAFQGMLSKKCSVCGRPKDY